MDPVGHASRACKACRRSVLDCGCALTKEVSAASPKTEGASCRHASQSMHVESTKKSPGTFSGTRFRGFAIAASIFILPDIPFVSRLSNARHQTLADPAVSWY